MSMAEKYGNFSISDIIFYDEIERDHFSEVFEKTYKKYTSKVNGKKVVGHGKLKRLDPDEKIALGVLNMQIQKSEERGITSIVGYGHRRVIFPLELYVRQLFDQGRIVSYEAKDNLCRSIEPMDDSLADEVGAFLKEKRRRLQLFQMGKLEPPAYRALEEKQRTK